eukprot:6270412-Amphidinium_carterae.1
MEVAIQRGMPKEAEHAYSSALHELEALSSVVHWETQVSKHTQCPSDRLDMMCAQERKAW